MSDNARNDTREAVPVLPPQDADAEMALLGSMMMSRDVITDVALIIGTPEAFYERTHQALYATLVALADAGKAIDLIVVTDELRRRQLLDEVGGQEYMIQLAESFADWANAEYYARIVRTQFERRCLITVGSEMRKEAYSPTGLDPAGIVADVARKLDAICNTNDESIRDVREYVSRLAVEPGEDGPGRCIPSGLALLDLNCGGGLERGAMIVVAGCTSMGKTALGVHFAIAALHSGVNVFFASVEMPPEQIAARILAATTGTPLTVVLRQSSPEDLQHTMAVAFAEWGDGRLLISDGITNLRDILAGARSRIRKDKVGLVILDYLQRTEPAERKENRNLEVSAMCAALKTLAIKEKVAVVVLSQLSRQAAAEDSPKLNHLRDSGSIEQDADVVIMLGKSKKNDTPGRNCARTVAVHIAKNRNGPLLSANVTFDPPTTRFLEIPRGPVESQQEALADVPF